MNIALAFDSNHSKFATSLIYNIKEVCSKKNIIFHLFVPEYFKDLEQTNSLEKKNIKFRYYYISKNQLSGMEVNQRNYPRITNATFYRLFIPHLLDSSVKRILYLDTDIYINNCFSSLFEMNLKKYPIAATPIKKMKKSISDNFNAGVLIIDVEKYKQKLSINKVLEFYETTKLDDQSILNYFFKDDYFKLEKIYNYPMSYFAININSNKKIYQEIKKAYIIHYLGKEKPWMYYCTLPLSNIFKRNYFKLHKSHPWEKITIIDIFKRIKRQIFRDIYLIRFLKHKIRNIFNTNK